MTKTKLKIDGMHCGSCAVGIDDSLEELPGVERASTSYARGRTKLVYDERQVDLETIRGVITQLGYRTE